MTTYAFNHSEKGVIQYKDKKRYFWLGSIFLSLLPSLTIGLYFVTNHSITLLVPLVFGYVFVPIMDYCMGTDRTNPPEEVVPQLESDSYYQWLTFVSTPIHYFSLIASVWFVCTVPLSIEIFLLFTISVGLYSGLSINTAHELGHKTTKIERLLAKISLSVTGYGHFSVEHNAGHHRDVATPEDTSSSRMGESIYRFALREIPGAIVRGWQLEAQRLQRHGLPLLSHKNVILQSYAITFLIQGGMIVLFGWKALLFLVIHNAVAWFQLTSSNYIEHYGLLRSKSADGKYEHCKPHHSWNANHIFSNLMLYQLERHSDHHANPLRRYQSLRSFDGLPELPSGYFGMYFIAYFPWLWFNVMDKRLLAVPHINGDLSKVNLDPKKAPSLIEKYA